MKKLIILPLLLLLFGCDYWSEYVFIIKNDSDFELQLKFLNDSVYYSNDEENQEIVYLSIDEEKIVRSIIGPLNSPVHDCLNEHGIGYFKELVFDIFVDGERVEKQIWLPENWQFDEISKWYAEYKMIITNELLE